MQDTPKHSPQRIQLVEPLDALLCGRAIDDTDTQSNTNEAMIVDFDNLYTDRSNRWKYQCSCKDQWGKPELKLICGDCEERFKRCA